mmetsp:Transcript_11374/g.32174  ORF Transcript_11374/g.32174 Transcript_11374/m.32174 type:complete len:227 (-) Transcript_11374:170-850(-)
MPAALRVRYEDTGPAPTEDIEALAKEQELTDGTLIEKRTVSNVISLYAKDHGINRRLRKSKNKKKMSKKDENFLSLSELVLTAIPPYPFRDSFVYRCINASPELVLWLQQRVGKLLKEPSFTSASAFSPQQQLDRLDLPNNYGTRNTYIAIRSRSGRLVRQYVRSKSYKEEWEVLFCYGTTFRVLSFEDTQPGKKHEVGTQGRYRIVMEEVKSRISRLKMAQLNEE